MGTRKIDMKEMTENKERSKETKESKESRDRKKAVVVAVVSARMGGHTRARHERLYRTSACSYRTVRDVNVQRRTMPHRTFAASNNRELSPNRQKT